MKGGSIKYVEGEGGNDNTYISLFSKLVNKGGGVKYSQNPVNLVYEYPQGMNL